ncbi:hypothetical protein HAX54_045993 [Datura stramonium]|uniref:Uncharacterized protein n=1 Tax=Datura stramonium TaxID=4076 RepID=A0ABS8RT38_DATST|nr:hypothetical protein [Datura stramonium]
MKNDPYPGMFQVLALTVVSVGVAVATVTDLQFHFFGACIAVAWIVPSAVNKILWSNLQQQENWTALGANVEDHTNYIVLSGDWSGALALGYVLWSIYKLLLSPGPTSILGAITALVGMSFYTYLNLHSQQQQQSSKTSSRQSPLSLSKSKLGKENADGRDGNRADESV